METIENAIEKIKKSPVYRIGDELLFKAGIEFAIKWISVDEELPEADDFSDTIEMKLDNGVILTGYRFSDGDFLYHGPEGNGRIITRKVTHWRYTHPK